MLATQPRLPTNTLGDRIRAVRTALDWKLGQTAKKMNMSRTSLSQWESNTVKNPDSNRLKDFARLTEINLDWLIDGKGEEPPFLTAPRRKSKPANIVDGSITDNMGSTLPKQQVVAEIVPNMALHANGIDLTPRAFWAIPQEVLELGFLAVPSKTVIKRVVTLDADAFGLERGDYVLVDTSRTRINEPGLYILADSDGRCALRALVDEKLKITRIGDDQFRGLPTPEIDEVTVLGRVMGIFKPT